MILEEEWEWITGQCSFSLSDWLADQPNDRNGEEDCLTLKYSEDGWTDSGSSSSMNINDFSSLVDAGS